jgi:CheY-like chemotaxis protein
VPEVVAGGEAALEALERGHFDLVLMDCQMPGMDGYSATIEIRRRERGGRRMPIVAMTANAVEGDRERCIDAGMDDYLSKPIRLAVLGKTLECWLGRVAEPA